MEEARGDPKRFMNANLDDHLAGTVADTYDDEKSEEVALGLFKNNDCKM